MDVHAEADPLHVQTVDEPPGGATVTVTAAQFQVQTVLSSDGELNDDDLQTGVGAQTPTAADPITEIENEEGACAGTDAPGEDSAGQSAGKTETLGSSCSNESCIPTPGCRICFQGAEQVKSFLLRYLLWVYVYMRHNDVFGCCQDCAPFRIKLRMP